MVQRVERKGPSPRSKRGIWILLCLLILAGSVTAAVLLTRSEKEETETGHQKISGSVTERSTDEIASITITRRGEEAWTVERTEDGRLRLRQQDSAADLWTVDEAIGNMLQDALANLAYEDVFTENRDEWEPNAADFGLAEPLVTALCRFTDGTELTVRVGNSADPEDDSCYYMAVDGDPRLYALTAGTVQDLNVDRSLLHPVTQPEIRSALLDRITVYAADGTVSHAWELRGQVTDQDAEENWIISAPFTYPADYEAIVNLKDSAANLRLGVYVADATPETRKAYGLDKPSARLELHMAAGSTGTVTGAGVYDVEDREENTVVLTIGGKKSDMTDYVCYENEIFAVTHFTLAVFTETDPMSTAARYVAPVPLNALESVVIEKAGEEPVKYALVRTENESVPETDETVTNGITDSAPAVEESDAAQASEAGFRCFRNSEEISADAFSAAYERLLTVTVSGKLPEGAARQETTVKYTFRSVSGGTHTLELCDFDAMHDAVILDGYTLFYLIKGGITELP